MSTMPPDQLRNIRFLIDQIDTHMARLDTMQRNRHRTRLLARALAALKKVAQETENSVDTLKEGC